MLFSRKHPELRRNSFAPESQDVEPSTSNEKMIVDDLVDSSFDINEHLSNSSDNVQNTQDPIDVNLVDFVKIKTEMFRELFAQIMKSKVLHHVPEEALDEIMRALLVASNQSNSIFKKKLKQAIASEDLVSSSGVK